VGLSCHKEGNEPGRICIIFYCLSPDFFGTEYYQKVEVPLALKKFEPQRALFYRLAALQLGLKRELANFSSKTDKFCRRQGKEYSTIETPENDRNWKKVINETFNFKLDMILKGIRSITASLKDYKSRIQPTESPPLFFFFCQKKGMGLFLIEEWRELVNDEENSI